MTNILIRDFDSFIVYELNKLAQKQNVSRNVLIKNVLTNYIMKDRRDKLHEEILKELKLIRETMQEGHDEAFESLMLFKKRMDFLNGAQSDE